MANELNDLVVDGMPKLKNPTEFCGNFETHVGHQFDSAKNLNLCKPQDAQLSYGPNESQNFHFGDFKRRASAADAELDLGLYPEAVHFKRRASANDANFMYESFEPLTYEQVSAQNFFQSLQYAQIAESVNTEYEAPSSAAFEETFYHDFNTNLNTNNFPQPAIVTRRASAADVFANIEHHKQPNADYLKRRASATDVECFSNNQATLQQPAALLCAAVSDGLIPYWHVGTEIKPINKNNARKKPSNLKTNAEERKNTDNIPIGLTSEVQANDVLRLFDILRKVHVCLNDVSIESEPLISHEFPTNFEKLQKLMPCTMNIRTHIKHIIYKCNGYCQEKSRKLDEYHCADREKYFECSRLIYVLRKLTKQLETFKTVDFEHRKSVFLHSFAAAKAKNLELLLTQIIDKIHECNVYVESYRSSIQKNIQEIGLTSLETLQKAIAIVAAMKTETDDSNEILAMNSNQPQELDACDDATATLEKSGDTSIKFDATTETDPLGSSRNAFRFVGTVL